MVNGNSISRRRFLQAAIATGAVVSVETIAPSPGSAASIAADVSYPAQFSHVAVAWKGNAILQIRSAVNNAFSEWVDVIPSHDLDTGNGFQTGIAILPTTNHAQVQVLSGSANNLALTPIPTGVTDPIVTAKSEPTFSAAAASTPSIITRAQWGANESLRREDPEFSEITKLIMHHSDTANNDPDPAATVRSIYEFHVNGNGWDDIGYNFLIDQNGLIYEGRWARNYDANELHNGESVEGLGVVGAHASRANAGSVGVCLLGNFASQAPSAAAIDSLGRLFAWKAQLHGVDANGASAFRFSDDAVGTFPNVSGHRDTYSTSCPGNSAYALLPNLRDRVGSLATIQSVQAKTGYLTASARGAVTAFGLSKTFGSMENQPLNSPIVSMATTPTNNGYWLLGGDGGVFSFGDAEFHGSTGGMVLNQPVLAFAPTPSGHGYWLAASDGGVFAYGDAGFYGSMGGTPLNKPVVGMASSPTGKGYWLVASDGGVFAFGDAGFYGSTGSIKLNQPISAMASHPTGKGYWMVASDGGIFAFGAAGFFGSVPGLHIAQYAGAKAIASTPTGNGYWILSSDGSINAFGDAQYLGDQVAPSGTFVAFSAKR